MSASPLETFKKLLETNPNDTRLRYMLANECLKLELYQEAITHLQAYLSMADDQGAGYGMLAQALLKSGRTGELRDAYQNGIAAANHHHHPSMALEFEEALNSL